MNFMISLSRPLRLHPKQVLLLPVLRSHSTVYGYCMMWPPAAPQPRLLSLSPMYYLLSQLHPRAKAPHLLCSLFISVQQVWKASARTHVQ